MRQCDLAHIIPLRQSWALLQNSAEEGSVNSQQTKISSTFFVDVHYSALSCQLKQIAKSYKVKYTFCKYFTKAKLL